MTGYDALYIALGATILIFLLYNLYLGIFIVLLTMAFFFTSSTETGFGPAKLVYAVVFTVWFFAWLLSKVFARSSEKKSVFWYPVAVSTTALGGVMGLSIIVGLVNNASLENIIRDLSLYVGYLAVFPVVDLVRKPGQAKKIIGCLAVIGLPSFILYEIKHIGYKQEVTEFSLVEDLPNGVHYWGPIQGAMWAVALAYDKILLKLVAWGSIFFTMAIILYSGYRGQMLAFFGAAAFAIILAGRLKPNFLVRFWAAIFIALAMASVFASAAGLIDLPFTQRTHELYGTLLSESRLMADDSAYQRVLEIKAQLREFAKNPIVGVGFGHTFAYRNYDGSWYGGANFTWHNGYSETLMKFGILGTTIFFWYYFSAIRMGFRYLKIGETFFARAIAFGTIIWLISGLMLSLVWGSQFAEKGFALTVGVMAGLLPGLANRHPYGMVEEKSETQLAIMASKPSVS